ncbi:hypothetical protein EUGRSUZ_D00932 [Eucalyptus grandis]|uniref:Uncharacterized protein n=2 Tax=Eucalyptus grandis TaxID=71139 RepID=A0ACC3L4S7_EUCGR|nr:hypothetical protein EUGRSUZ_D00932 [Eucalyptus grandis]
MVGTEEYISMLPNCLTNDFSFLPTRDTVKICILSIMWQSVWTAVLDLRFSVSSYDNSFVEKVLMLYGRGKV